MEPERKKLTIRELFRRPPTQGEVAAHIGVDPSIVNRWIQGRSIPNGINLQRLSKYFGVSADDIDLVTDYEEGKRVSAR